MIVCVCNCLREKDCIATAEDRSTRSAGGVYKQGLCEKHTRASAARYEELGR